MLFAGILVTTLMGPPRLPDTLNAARFTADRDASAASVTPLRALSAKGIELRGAYGIEEVLKTFAGVNIKDYGGIGGLKTVSLRNFGSQHTAVCYDGITISNAQNGQVDIGRFNLENVNGISVTIGGSDDIFRSARLLTYAGVLDISSIKPDAGLSGPHFDASIRLASFGTYNPYLIYRQRLGRNWATTFSFNYLNSDGNYPFILENGDRKTAEKRLNSDVSTINTEFNVLGDFGEGGELTIKACFLDSRRGLPGSVILYTRNQKERLADRDLTAAANYVNSFNGKWKLKAGLSYNGTWNRYTNNDAAYPVPVDDRYLQQEFSATTTGLFALPGGFEISIAEDFFINTLDSSIPECPFPVRTSSVSALSAKYSNERLTLTGNLALTVIREKVRTGSSYPGMERLSPTISLSYKLLKNSDLRLRASFRRGFRAPTFNDLYYARVGNITLAPEKASQFNLGLSWVHPLHRGTFSITADGYFNNVKDKIAAIPTMFIWKMRNIGKAEMAGVDINVSYVQKLLEWMTLRASANYSYQYAADVSDPKAKNYGDQIPYTPKHTGGWNIGVETRWVNLSYVAIASGERYALAQNLPENRIAPYTDHGISLNHTFNLGHRHPWRLHLSAEALNLGNRNYEIIRYYPMPGRNYRISIKISC